MKLEDTPTEHICLMIAASQAGGDPNLEVIDSLTAELEGRLSTEVDESSGPADMDQALAKFLLAYIRTKPNG